MKVCALIPAREGSTRLKHKNKKLLCGNPLIQWTIDVAKQCDFFDEIIVSTDDEDILEIANKCSGILPVRRPPTLAGPHTPMWAVVEHAFQHYPNDTVVVLLQPTSPLRTYEDVLCCWRLFQIYGMKSGVYSVYWELDWKLPMKELYLNGAVFLHYLGTIKNTKSFIQQGNITYIMPKDRSIDIDTKEDFLEAERLMKIRLKNDRTL